MCSFVKIFDFVWQGADYFLKAPYSVMMNQKELNIRNWKFSEESDF